VLPLKIVDYLLTLPPRFPSPEAMRSCKHDASAYCPEAWKAQYRRYRYLENLPTDRLQTRYDEIVKNLTTLYTSDRDVIPIQTPLSSWYWFRKEHQARLEFNFRGLTPQHLLRSIQPIAVQAPARPHAPNYGDVLFRYSKTQYVLDSLREGKIRLSPASSFAAAHLDPARRDNEQRKERIYPSRYTKLTKSDGTTIPASADILEYIDGPDYYVWCLSCDYRSTHFSDFDDSDACMVIFDTDTLATRIEAAVGGALPGWLFHHNPVEYFDPYERFSEAEIFYPELCKDFRFAYQMEYRFTVFPPAGQEANGYLPIHLEPLHDVAFMVEKPGRPEVAA